MHVGAAGLVRELGAVCSVDMVGAVRAVGVAAVVIAVGAAGVAVVTGALLGVVGAVDGTNGVTGAPPRLGAVLAELVSRGVTARVVAVPVGALVAAGRLIRVTGRFRPAWSACGVVGTTQPLSVVRPVTTVAVFSGSRTGPASLDDSGRIPVVGVRAVLDSSALDSSALDSVSEVTGTWPWTLLFEVGTVVDVETVEVGTVVGEALADGAVVDPAVVDPAVVDPAVVDPAVVEPAGVPPPARTGSCWVRPSTPVTTATS